MKKNIRQLNIYIKKKKSIFTSLLLSVVETKGILQIYRIQILKISSTKVKISSAILSICLKMVTCSKKILQLFQANKSNIQQAAALMQRTNIIPQNSKISEVLW